MLTRTYRFILETCTRFRLRNKREGKRPIRLFGELLPFCWEQQHQCRCYEICRILHRYPRFSCTCDGTVAGAGSRVGPAVSQALDRLTGFYRATISFARDRSYQNHMKGHIMKRFDSQRFDIQRFDNVQFFQFRILKRSPRKLASHLRDHGHLSLEGRFLGREGFGIRDPQIDEGAN